MRMLKPINWRRDDIALGCHSCGGGEMVYEPCGKVSLRATTKLLPPNVHSWRLYDGALEVALPPKEITVGALTAKARRAKRSLAGFTLHLSTPLRGATYQCRRDGAWLLVGTDEGYA